MAQLRESNVLFSLNQCLTSNTRFGTCYESSVLISGFIDWVIHQETRFTGIISFDGGWEASYREVSRLCIRDAWYLRN